MSLFKYFQRGKGLANKPTEEESSRNVESLTSATSVAGDSATA